jgi:hypothetical protein
VNSADERFRGSRSGGGTKTSSCIICNSSEMGRKESHDFFVGLDYINIKFDNFGLPQRRIFFSGTCCSPRGTQYYLLCKRPVIDKHDVPQ